MRRSLLICCKQMYVFKNVLVHDCRYNPYRNHLSANKVWVYVVTIDWVKSCVSDVLTNQSVTLAIENIELP